MSRVFVIGDLHFGHRNIPKYRGLPDLEYHDNLIVENWNKTVNERDLVWVLGDVFFSKEAALTVGLLNGTKKLVLGNHDTFPMEIYQRYFTKIFSAVKYKSKCIFTHIPIHPSQLDWRWNLPNVHGHIHHVDYLIDDPRYICVAAEHINYTPQLIDDILGA